MDTNDTKLDRRDFIRALATAGVAVGALTLEAPPAEAASCPKFPKAKKSKEIVPVHIVSEVGDVIDGEMDLTTVERSADGRSLSFELFFDGFEEGIDVHGSTDKVLTLTLVNQELHRPPTALLTWGTKSSFKCVFESARAGFTLFLDDGTPVRAIVLAQLQVFDDCTLGVPGTP